MDFALRYDRWYRVMATVMALGPSNTIIRVANDVLRVAHGWAFRIEIPLQEISSARQIAERPFAWGVHTTGEYWYVMGSRDGIVELRLAHPVTSTSVKFQAGKWAELRRLYLSLEDPDGFIAAVSARDGEQEPRQGGDQDDAKGAGEKSH